MKSMKKKVVKKDRASSKIKNMKKKRSGRDYSAIKPMKKRRAKNDFGEGGFKITIPGDPIDCLSTNIFEAEKP